MTTRSILALLVLAGCGDPPTYPPAPVEGLEGERGVELAAGGGSICVRTSDVDVACVERGSDGEIVRWTAEAPAPIARLARVGGAVCMIDAGHRMVCERMGEVVLGPLDDVVRAAPSLCVIGAAGDVRCRRRDGSFATLIESGASDLASGGSGPGDDALCAVVDGSVRCFGFGALTPGADRAVIDAADVELGSDHACALRADGTVACWGANDAGQLGVEEPDPRTEPTVVPGIDDAIALGLGPKQSCVIRVDESVWCWGSLRLPELEQSAEPQPVGVVGAIAVQDRCALTHEGVVLCWSEPRP